MTKLTIFDYPAIVRAAGDAAYATVKSKGLRGKEKDIAYRAMSSEALGVTLGRRYAREFYWAYSEELGDIAQRYVVENGDSIVLPTTDQMIGWRIDFNRGRVIDTSTPARDGQIIGNIEE
jgi:hypothetical protein